jgi:two-component system, NtrC family, sensor kinase
MIKKYPWHFVYLLFVILCLINIFQKLKWSTDTDNILWQKINNDFVCVEAPPNSTIKKGDKLYAVNNFEINNKVDIYRVIQKRKLARYDIERDGISKIVRVDIVTKYTSTSYYILAFSGILLILLTLRILNTTLIKKKGFQPPTFFFLMSLSFSGFLIFSPTGAYNTTDFIFLVLDRISFIFFPALMLHYSLYFPIKLRILRYVNPKLIKLLIYLIPSTILFLNAFFLLPSLVSPVQPLILLTINHFRQIVSNYFGFFILLSLTSFISSNLWFIFKRKQKRFWIPLCGVCIGIPSTLIINGFLPATGKSTATVMHFLPILTAFLPVSLTYYLGHRKFTDIENIIKKTLSVASIFIFIFGIFFFLGSAIEQNKLLGIFWSMAAIMTAGLLYRPIEETVHKFFERLFFKGAAGFKKKLTELIQSFRNERDLTAIATNFLNTINSGFQLRKSAFIIHSRKNIFYSMPEKRKMLFSNNFRSHLFQNENLIIFSSADFERRYPKDYRMLKDMNYFQFLPLKTQDKLIGFVAFGPKEDKTYLSVEDWDIMFNISSPLTLSVENATLYSELENQLSEISLLKEFNENIIENINVGIVVLTRLNIIKTWNEFMEAKFRIKADEAIGKKAHNTLGHNLWKQIYREKRSVKLSSIHNVKVVIDDEELIFDIHISPLKNSQQKIIGTIVVFEDVTEKLMMQNQLVTSEKMASLGLLSAGIAHEVNTPLTGISSYCQFILDNPEDPENIELTMKIQEQVQRANKIIRSLLNFSRQKGEIPTELDMNKLLNESVALVEHSLKKKNIAVKKEYEFKNKMFGFTTRLQQLFINLLINAGDAISNPEGVISILGSETDADITIRVKDNGKGIDQKYLKKIFDPFFTTKEMGKGTGLGLSISYNIVEEHYGQISVNSKLDKGTSFIINFPVKSPLRSIKL